MGRLPFDHRETEAIMKNGTQNRPTTRTRATPASLAGPHLVNRRRYASPVISGWTGVIRSRNGR